MLDFSQNYFALLGLTSAFDVDGADLSRRYRDVQTSIHPDRYAGRSEQEQRLAVQMASRVNEAYQCLKHPLSRALYLLELVGYPVLTQGHTHRDATFLMEQIELREELERAATASDSGAALDTLLEQIETRIASVQLAVREAFAEKNYERAAGSVVKWQFLVKLQTDTENLREQVKLS